VSGVKRESAEGGSLVQRLLLASGGDDAAIAFQGMDKFI
jgi:hypothetical protein